jgi:hypothetical protein
LRQKDRLDEAAAAHAAVRVRTVRPELAQAMEDVHRLRGDDHFPVRSDAVARAKYDAPVARRSPFPSSPG